MLCTEAQLEADLVESDGGCPAASQVGTVTSTTVTVGTVPLPTALYNMVPPPGVAAELGFSAVRAAGIFVHLMGRVNSAGEYELGIDTNEIPAPQKNPILGAQVQLWGNPSDSSHDSLRGYCAKNETENESGFRCLEPTERLDAPFLTMPSSCRSSLTVTANATPWEEPRSVTRSAQVEDPATGEAVGTEGCNQLDFSPTISAKPTTNLADSPSGLDFDLHIPQHESVESLGEANLKDAKVTLPAGMAINPSGGNGLQACTPAQFGLISAVGQLPVRTSADPAACPDGAKIGNLEVNTQLLDHRISGAIYVAQPYQNPFGSLLAIYLAINDPATGTVIKLAGKVEADPQTGQLTATFKDNPELPFEDFKLRFFGGPRAALRTPLACGTYTTTSTFTPWSAPEGADATPSDSFATTVAASGGGNCPSSEADAPNRPSFEAGAMAPQAGAYSPFVLKLSREDGTQRITAIDTTLPKGLLAKLAGIPYCSEAQIAASKSREAPNQGALEQRSPSCPASSEVGTVNVGAGAGITPFYVQGHAYLAGPYKGAPLSLVIITPAVAGPYDLGSVVNRTALYVNSKTAEVHAVSDPLPTILQGIPLDVRSIALRVDRPDFTLNPTSCDPMAIEGTASTVPGGLASLRSPFQLGGCESLGFKPKLAFRLKGATKRGDDPALVATYSPRKGDANLKGLVVRLPRSAFLDQAHIRTICTRVQFAADSCPKGARYGSIKAFTPLLDEALQGPVYLRSSSHKLPDLVFDLHGIVDVEVAARIDSIKGGIRASIEAAPDAPLDKVLLRMQGAKKGLIVNSRNLCSAKSKADVSFSAQNGKELRASPAMRADCGGKRKR